MTTAKGEANMATGKPWRGAVVLAVTALVAASVAWFLLPRPSYERGYEAGYKDGFEAGYAETYLTAFQDAEEYIRRLQDFVLNAYWQGVVDGQEECTVQGPFAPCSLDAVEGALRLHESCTVQELREWGLTVLPVTLKDSQRSVAGVWAHDQAGRVFLLLVDTDCTPADVWELLPDVGVKIE